MVIAGDGPVEYGLGMRPFVSGLWMVAPDEGLNQAHPRNCRAIQRSARLKTAQAVWTPLKGRMSRNMMDSSGVDLAPGQDPSRSGGNSG